ncbi:M48 family metallopeptidase [bacterium]|nr:M48 family metallopeptidase [bacterium]
MTEKYRDITYNLVRSNRKTISIYIERDGSITIRVPESFVREDVEKIIEGKRYWIYKSLAEWRELNATRVQRQFVSGEGFLYLGRSYRLKLVRDQKQSLVLKQGYFLMPSDNTGSPASNPDDMFKEFYRERGKIKIPERVSYYEGKMGVYPQDVRVMELKNRWASCTSKGRLNFHWKCMMAPVIILDYIVVHEMTHLIHSNHTEVFWNEVDKVLPDYRERKKWLRVNGAGMGL